MAYVRLDDQIAHHPKVLRAGAEAAWLWAVSIAYCNRQLTDGHIPTAALATMGAFRTPPKRLASALVAVGLFEVDGDGYRVHDYLAHNPSRALVLERMGVASARKADYRTRKGRERDADVPVGHTRDTRGTRASSRAHVPTPTPTPTPTTDTECVSVVAHTPTPAAADGNADWGPSPVRKHSGNNAYSARRAGLHVPQFLHAELLSRMATPDEPALFAWYASTEREWDGRAIGETALKFWRARFEAWQGVTPKAGPVDDWATWVPSKLRVNGGAE